MVATKEQERAALKKIEKIINDLGGMNSYIGMAFDGCLMIAADNIENDFGNSMKQRAEQAEQENIQTKIEVSELKQTVTELERKTKETEADKTSWKNRAITYTEELSRLRDSEAEAYKEIEKKDQTIKEQEQEITILKAKLYDLMTA